MYLRSAVIKDSFHLRSFQLTLPPNSAGCLTFQQCSDLWQGKQDIRVSHIWCSVKCPSLSCWRPGFDSWLLTQAASNIRQENLRKENLNWTWMHRPSMVNIQIIRNWYMKYCCNRLFLVKTIHLQWNSSWKGIPLSGQSCFTGTSCQDFVNAKIQVWIERTLQFYSQSWFKN